AGESVTLGEGVGSFGERLVEAWVRHLRALVRGAVAEAHDDAGFSDGRATTLPTGVPWPLTPVQRGMVLHALEAPVDRYTSAIDVGLDGPLDVAALRAAAADVLAAHPQLRLAVAARGPQDVGLVVTDVTEVPLREVTLPDDVAHPVRTARDAANGGSGGSPTPVGRISPDGAGDAAQDSGTGHLDDPHPDAVRRALDEIMADELDRPFDLARPPLLRLVVVRVGSHEGARHRLVVTNHHVLLDGWSVPFLVDLLLGAYVRRVGAPAGATPSGSGPATHPTGLVPPTPGTAWQLSRRLARRD
ncbi:hypothetical protein DLJ96_18010, partial [Actinotalea fermentans ATCC 43279 = JCM 9966 = DSM 3133]